MQELGVDPIASLSAFIRVHLRLFYLPSIAIFATLCSRPFYRKAGNGSRNRTIASSSQNRTSPQGRQASNRIGWPAADSTRYDVKGPQKATAPSPPAPLPQGARGANRASLRMP